MTAIKGKRGKQKKFNIACKWYNNLKIPSRQKTIMEIKLNTKNNHQKARKDKTEQIAVGTKENK